MSPSLAAALLLGIGPAVLLVLGLGLGLPRVVAGSPEDQRFAQRIRSQPAAWITAMLFAVLLIVLVLLRFDPGPLLLGFLALAAAMTVWLVPIDLARHRLPDRIVLPGSLLALALLGLGLALGEGPARWMLVLGGLALVPAGLIWLVPVIVQAITRADGPTVRAIGLGDAKLLPLVAALSALQGPGGAIVMLVACSLASLLVVGLGLLTGRLDRRARIAFGPYLLLGAWTGALLGPLGTLGWD